LAEPVPSTPPAGLVAAQRIATTVAERAVAEAGAGTSEIELRDRIEGWLAEAGAPSVWSITNVGFGARSTICFPDQPPTGNRLHARDVGHVDVHPVGEDDWWGDCTRTLLVGGGEPEHAAALTAVRAIHEETLSHCVPGMRACDLFAGCLASIEAAGYRLLDPWRNIGHSLRRGSAYDEKFVDATNGRPLWGAWAVEPFLGTDAFGVKLEDVVWFGPDGCTVLR
jgi:Xaa-Pro dipeptidase